jgi:enoyl-CoA hydratase/carnithine racemase
VSGLVRVEQVGNACVLTLSREEKLNALSTNVERELLDALERPELATSGCVVICGSGGAFSAGADVTEFRGQDPDAIARYYRETGHVYERVASLPQPSIAAVHGWCLGGGLELALACDFRVADSSAVFGLPEVELGILPSSGGTYRLVRLVGPARAKELMFLRTRFGVEEARELGLVTEVVAAGRARSRALELAERLAGLPPLAVSLAKEAADRMPESSRETGLLLERLAYAALAQTPEASAAAEAFERRSASEGSESEARG